MTESRTPDTTGPGRRPSNARVATSLGLLVAGMVGLSFAAVPLYDLFCRVTGYGGTTQVADGYADRVVDRKITIRFNADVNDSLPWGFRPEAVAMTVNLGQSALTSYRAENRGADPVVGTATYNVTPAKAGIYFNKLECFCFTEQVLTPRQSVDMPVYFFVDPAMADDPNMDDVDTITLSYTFFRAPDQTLATQAVSGTGAPETTTPRDNQSAAAAPAGTATAGRLN